MLGLMVIKYFNLKFYTNFNQVFNKSTNLRLILLYFLKCIINDVSYKTYI